MVCLLSCMVARSLVKAFWYLYDPALLSPFFFLFFVMDFRVISFRKPLWSVMQPQIKIPIVLEFPIYLKFNWLEETAGIFEKKSRFKFWDFLDWSLLAQEVLYWKPSYFTCQSDTLPDFLPVFMFLTDFHTGLWGSDEGRAADVVNPSAHHRLRD